MEDLSNVFIDPDKPDVDYAELDFDDQLKHTQRVKGRLLHKLVTSENGLPTDKDSVELILKVADSMDKTTVAKKRLAVDEKSGNDAISILNAIAQSIQTSGGHNPFLRQEGTPIPANQDIGELKSFDGVHAKGEGEIGVIIETSDKFIPRMDIVNQEDMARRAAEMGLTDDK